jgi:hypothetical protein
MAPRRNGAAVREGSGGSLRIRRPSINLATSWDGTCPMMISIPRTRGVGASQ